MHSETVGLLTDSADDELVLRAIKKEEAAIKTIIRRHNRTLFRLARSVLPDDEAEDAVQEAYIRAFARISSFRGEASLRTWLCRIVLNEALGRVRRHRPTLELEVLETAGPGQVIPLPLRSSPDPEHMMAQDQIRRILERAIDDLPLAFRTVLVARLIEEMSVEETADVLGLRPETVRTRLHRARRLLRTALEQRLGAVLGEAFPFEGERCQRMADQVFARISPPA